MAKETGALHRWTKVFCRLPHPSSDCTRPLYQGIQGRANHFAVGGFMTKADLVDHVTALGDLTRRDGEVIVETLFDSIIDALKTNDKVEVRGFGSFRSRQRKPRTGRNPKTGESVAVPAKRVPYFKPSKELRDLVNPDEANGSRKSATQKSAANGVVDLQHPPAM
jgi:integration host factor subunit beta